MDNDVRNKCDETIAVVNKTMRNEFIKTMLWAVLSAWSISEVAKHSGRVGYVCGLKTTTELIKEKF